MCYYLPKRVNYTKKQLKRMVRKAEKVRKMMEENPELFKEMEEKIKQKTNKLSASKEEVPNFISKVIKFFKGGE